MGNISEGDGKEIGGRIGSEPEDGEASVCQELWSQHRIYICQHSKYSSPLLGQRTNVHGSTIYRSHLVTWKKYNNDQDEHMLISTVGD